MNLNILYRNFLESKWPFYNWKDENWLISVDDAKKRWAVVKGHMKVITVKRPPNKAMQISIPISEEECPENPYLADIISDKKTETKMSYLVNEILDQFYYWIDWFFHKREERKEISKREFWALFAIREAIDWISRITPIKVRTAIEKETQKVSFMDWNISQDIRDVEFTYRWEKYKTNIFGSYAPNFRDAMFPNSDFDWFRLQKRQRDAKIRMWRVTVIVAGRWLGKSYSNTSWVWTYLFKELNMDFEQNRPFLIVYWWLSKEANLQVVEYIRAMAKKLTTNKNILKWNSADQILTLYDGHNERKIKFVSQWQEWGWYTWLRPHLVVLDEAARLEDRMYTIALGTAEAQIVLISTLKKWDQKNWFYSLYQQAIKKQREYRDIYEVIAEIRIRYWMHKVTTREEYMEKVNAWVIRNMRFDLWKERPVVWLKYTIDDNETITQEEKDMMIEAMLEKSEEDCLTELFSEYADSWSVFNTDWLLESVMPDRFDCISYWYDEADDSANEDMPAIVFAGAVWRKSFVLHSEVLDKKDHIARYNRIKELERQFQKKSALPIVKGSDITRLPSVLMREQQAYLWEIDCNLQYTPAQHKEIKREFPKYLIGKNALIEYCSERFYKAWNIQFSSDLDTEWGLIEEIGNFKSNWKTIKWQKNRRDDQVNAKMICLFTLYKKHIESRYWDQYSPSWESFEDRREAIIQAENSNKHEDISNLIHQYR